MLYFEQRNTISIPVLYVIVDVEIILNSYFRYWCLKILKSDTVSWTIFFFQGFPHLPRCIVFLQISFLQHLLQPMLDCIEQIVVFGESSVMGSGRLYHFEFFKGCLSQILLSPFSNILTHMFDHIDVTLVEMRSKMRSNKGLLDCK